MWDNALAEQDSRYSESQEYVSTMPAQMDNELPLAAELRKPEAFPNMDEMPTVPMGLDEKTPAQRAAEAIEIVGLFHHRIANTIRTLWGYKECSSYINKLIMNGGDGMGHNRVGFNPEAAQAMLVLADLHDEIFGPAEADKLHGFSDSYHSSFDGHR
eukprot:gene16823-biopygen14798